MHSQQSYPMFAINHGHPQESFGGYPHPSQAYIFTQPRSDNNLVLQPLGELAPPAPGLSWTPPAALEPPGYLSLQGPPQQVREQSRCGAEQVTVKEEDQPEAKYPTIHYYAHYWNNYWTAGPGPSPSHQQVACSVYPTPTTQSPQIPGDASAPTVESSQCSSISSTSQEAADEEEADEVQELPTREEMEKFAKDVKQKRVALGFTQSDVGCTLGVLYGRMFSQTTICRFESLQLSPKNMVQLKPLLNRWLNDAEKSDDLQELITKEQTSAQSRKRKRRTNIDNMAKDSLEICFSRNPKPGALEMAHLARELHLDKEVVRVWFCNRRQRDRRHVPANSPSGESGDMQHMVNPYMMPFPPPQEMPPLNYMAPPLGPMAPTSPPFCPHGFNNRNDMFPQPMPQGMPQGMPYGNQN